MEISETLETATRTNVIVEYHLKTFVIVVIFTLVHATQNVVPTEKAIKSLETITRFAKEGTDVVLECHLCDVDLLKWTYKSSNRTQEDIAENNNLVRSKNYGRKNPWFRLGYNSTCIYYLFLDKIQIDAVGIYSCWRGTVEIRQNHVIVINEADCFVEPNVSDSKNVLLKQNDSITIKCPFQYSADESCIVTPIWTDLTGHKNLTMSGNDYEVKMEDLQASIHIKPGADIINGTRFNLSYSFNCSFSNNSQDIQMRDLELYEFGQLPFTFFVEEAIRNSWEHNTFNLTIAWGQIIVVLIVAAAVSLLLVLLKKCSKLCFANNQKRTDAEAPSDIPMGDRYLRIQKDLQSKGDFMYEEIVNNTYETIVDP